MEKRVIIQDFEILKKGIKIIKRISLYYIAQDGGKLLKIKPWVGNAFSFLYDLAMKRSIFPKKFGGDINRHYEILANELNGVHEKRVLELATGCGSAVNFLPNDNEYSGIDISPGLLRKAVKSFSFAGFKNADFYVASSDDLPFDDNIFDITLCILSLNFFNDIKKVFQELKRVLVPGALFICCIPVPERNRLQSRISGTLYAEEELNKICRENGFCFESISVENGALLYFRSIIQ
jgi:SAM-dependent methyltransferase